MLNLQSVIRYLIQGLAVATVAYLVLRNQIDQQDILKIAALTAVSFAILDQFAPGVSLGAPLGTGVGLGMKLTGGAEEEEF